MVAVGWFMKPSAAITVAVTTIVVNPASKKTRQPVVLLPLDNGEPMPVARHVNASNVVNASSRLVLTLSSVQAGADRKPIANALRLMNCHLRLTLRYP
jgi:hypothetical protein